MICTYKYRLYPNKKQVQAIDNMINRHRWLYNEALAQRNDIYKQEKKSVKYTDQSKWLTQHRKENETYQKLNFSSCQRTLKRLDKSFQAFFRRVKSGETPGYPRFKGYNRFDSTVFTLVNQSSEFTYGDGVLFRKNDLLKHNGCLFQQKNRLYVQHIGEVKIKLHRGIEGKIKTVIIRRQAGCYYACFSVDRNIQVLEEYAGHLVVVMLPSMHQDGL